jgi:hypothetical protein
MLWPTEEINLALETLHRDTVFGVEHDKGLHSKADWKRVELPNGTERQWSA